MNRTFWDFYTGFGLLATVFRCFAAVLAWQLGSLSKETGYFGIVPSVRASGEREEQGRITRQGRSEVRAVWIQAAHALARCRQPAARPLQRWFHRVAYRRGLRTALVALARRMLSLAFYLLRDGDVVRTPATALGSGLIPQSEIGQA